MSSLGFFTNGKYERELERIAYSLDSQVKLVQIEFWFEAVEQSGKLLN